MSFDLNGSVISTSWRALPSSASFILQGASAAFIQSEANNGCSQLKLRNRTLEVLWHSGFSKYTWSVCEDNMVMLTVSKWWTDVIHWSWGRAFGPRKSLSLGVPLPECPRNGLTGEFPKQTCCRSIVLCWDTIQPQYLSMTYSFLQTKPEEKSNQVSWVRVQMALRPGGAVTDPEMEHPGHQYMLIHVQVTEGEQFSLCEYCCWKQDGKLVQ